MSNVYNDLQRFIFIYFFFYCYLFESFLANKFILSIFLFHNFATLPWFPLFFSVLQNKFILVVVLTFHNSTTSSCSYSFYILFSSFIPQFSNVFLLLLFLYPNELSHEDWFRSFLISYFILFLRKFSIFLNFLFSWF